MADAPQVVYTETSPGAQLINQPYPEPFLAHDHETVYSPTTADEHEESKEQQSGHKQVSRRTVLIIILILLIVGGVGGGVGGSMAVKKERDRSKARDKRIKATQTLSVIPSPTYPDSIASPTASIYRPLRPSQVALIDNSCPPGATPIIRSSRNEAFLCISGSNCLGPYRTMMHFAAYTLQDCVDACSSWNLEIEKYPGTEPGNVTCDGVSLSSVMSVEAEQKKGTCWLKGAVSEECLQPDSRITVAMLCRNGRC